MPILSDASIGDAVDVGGDEIDRLTLTLELPEVSREVTAETQVRDDPVIGYDHLLNLAAEVGDRKAHEPRCCQRSSNSLGAPGRQRLVDKVRRKGGTRQCFVPGIPESIIAPRGGDLRVDLCSRQTAIDYQVIWLYQ